MRPKRIKKKIPEKNHENHRVVAGRIPCNYLKNRELVIEVDTHLREIVLVPPDEYDFILDSGGIDLIDRYLSRAKSILGSGM